MPQGVICSLELDIGAMYPPLPSPTQGVIVSPVWSINRVMRNVCTWKYSILVYSHYISAQSGSSYPEILGPFVLNINVEMVLISRLGE